MIQRVRGTRDFAPGEMSKRRHLEGLLRQISSDYGYREIQTPTIENSELFVAKSGPGVLEEMYSFSDKGGREIALRPELTAPIIRFFVNDLTNYPMPLKLFCISNCFRYEEPQAGRYREFHQFDLEIIGSDAAEADAELLILANDLCGRLGLKGVKFRIGHVGIVRSLLDRAGIDKKGQSAFLRFVDKKKYEEAEAFLAESGVPGHRVAEILDTCRLTGEPSILDGIEGESAHYLREVLEIADKSGAENLHVDLGVVRGLDYYTGVVFELDYPDLGAEKQICGGGSYSLAQLFGGQTTPSTGMAFGFDRLLLAMEKAGTAKEDDSIEAFVLAVTPSLRDDMLGIASELRQSGIKTETDLMRRSMSKALKYASSRGALVAIIAGEKEKEEGKVTVRDMRSGEQNTVKRSDVTRFVLSTIGGTRA